MTLETLGQQWHDEFLAELTERVNRHQRALDALKNQDGSYANAYRRILRAERAAIAAAECSGETTP